MMIASRSSRCSVMIASTSKGNDGARRRTMTHRHKQQQSRTNNNDSNKGIMNRRRGRRARVDATFAGEEENDRDDDDDDDDVTNASAMVNAVDTYAFGEQEEVKESLRELSEKEIMKKRLTDDLVEKFVVGRDMNYDSNDRDDDETNVFVDEDGEVVAIDEDDIKVIVSKDERREEMLRNISLPKRASMRGSVKLFLDSADYGEWRKWLPTGLFFGVTTNVQMLEKSDSVAQATDAEFSFQTLLDLVDAALEYDCVKEVHVPAWGMDSDEIWKNGIVLARNDPQRIVVAVPCSYEGIKAANALVADGARVQISGVFAPHQALMAAAIGASYVAPTFGKMYDAGRDGFKETVEMIKALKGCGSESKVLVKNVRSAVDLSNLGSVGCDTFSVSATVCEEMFSDPLTAQYNKELNVSVDRIREKQKSAKLELQKQKQSALEAKKQPMQDDEADEVVVNEALQFDSSAATVAAAEAAAEALLLDQNKKAEISLEEMPATKSSSDSFDDDSTSYRDEFEEDAENSAESSNVIDSDDFTFKEKPFL